MQVTTVPSAKLSNVRMIEAELSENHFWTDSAMHLFAHNNDVRPPGAAEVFNPPDDFLHRALALYQRGEEADVQAGEAARKNLDHVRDGGAAGRGDDPDTPRKARQRTFSFGREKAFGGEFLLELLEG